MKWDGQALVDDIKYGLNLLLTDKDKKNAQIMKHKEFTSYLKNQHILDMEPFSRCIGAGSIVLTCNSYGVDFDFQRELNNLGDRKISLTWSMAARYIRTWECEKANDTSKEEKTLQCSTLNTVQEQWDKTHLCGGSVYVEGHCEYLIEPTEDTVINGKKVEKCSIYCTSENKVRKIGTGGLWTGLSPKFCPKRRALEQQQSMCDSCINKDENCLIPSEDECIGYTSVNDKVLSIANEQKEDKPMAAPKAFNFNSFISENNQVKKIPLDMLVPYHNHKFKLYEGERLNDMVQSVKSNGVIIPIIVRPVNGGDKYEILAGHNRTNAARLAGLKNIPAFVRENLTDEEAEIYVVETNVMQRGFDDLSITERAAVIAARHSAMFDEDKRKAIERELAIMNGDEVEEQEGDTTDEEGESKKSKLAAVGENYGLSKDSVARLIRIDKLVDELKPYVDNGTLKIRTAVNLSYLLTFEQIKVSEYIEDFGMDMKKSAVLREASKQKRLNGNDIREIMKYGNLSSSDGEVAATRKPMKVKISTDVCDKYFAPDWDEKKVQEIIEAALERYFNGLENSGDIDRLIMDDEDKYQI